jgi:hypothetical protein
MLTFGVQSFRGLHRLQSHPALLLRQLHQLACFGFSATVWHLVLTCLEGPMVYKGDLWIGTLYKYIDGVTEYGHGKKHAKSSWLGSTQISSTLPRLVQVTLSLQR